MTISQNSVGNTLSSQTGTGKFVGDTSPTLSAPTLIDPVTVTTPPAPLTLIDTQTFTSNGTWTKPVGANYVDVLIMGGGGGGGSGACGITATNRLGGNGGNGAGCFYIRSIPAGVLSATQAVTVGTSGAGGAGTAVTGNGNSGSNGGSSFFHKYEGVGGLGGFFGTNGASSQSKSITILATGFINYVEAALETAYRDELNLATLTSSAALVGQSTVTDGSAGNSTSNFGGGIFEISRTAPTGGTPGGSINSSNVTTPNSTFNFQSTPLGNNTFPAYMNIYSLSAAPVTVAGGTTTGNNGGTYATYYGVGGTGGYSNSAGSAYAGGNGGNYGAGGGGGGATLAGGGNTSGAGGNGAGGLVVVFSYS